MYSKIDKPLVRLNHKLNSGMKKGTTLTKTIQVKDEAIQTYDNKLELK